MRVAFVASEAAPFAKTGGLGDVVGALPKALFRLGHEPALVLPFYRVVRETGLVFTEVARVSAPVARRTIEAVVFQTRLPGADVPAYLLQCDEFYDRDNLYGDNGDYWDNCARFTFLSRAAIETLRAVGFRPDVLHVHDWQTALIPAYLKAFCRDDPHFAAAGTLLTIHNMLHQGIFWHYDMEVIGFDWSWFTPQRFEFWGNINFLKAGILYADVINTVSPTYAREIETPRLGQGLDGVLRDRDDALHGVVNGIDEHTWNPAADKHLPVAYSSADLAGKAACKRALQRQCKLPVRKTPLVGIVSRFADQKGLDLAAAALPALFEQDAIQCVVLGDGDLRIRDLLQSVQRRYPAQMHVAYCHDERLAHRVIAAADMVLVPSRFEPCGLTQLYGLRYGSVPVARRTGGLADTVTDCTPDNLANGTATGFLFDDPTPEALVACVRRALTLYHDRKAWERLMQIGMAQDWSWDASARRYVELYQEAQARRLRV